MWPILTVHGVALSQNSSNLMRWLARLARWPGDHRATLAAGFFGITLSVAAWFAGDRYWDLPNARGEIAALGDNRRLLVQEVVDDLTEALRVARVFVGAMPGTLDKAAFAALINDAGPKSVQDMEVDWLPRVKGPQRSGYEKQAESDGLSDFHIAKLNSDGILVPEDERPEYFPVRYSVNSVKSPPVIGLDVSSLQIEREAMERARDTGALSSTPLHGLATDAGFRMGYVIFSAVYRPNLSEPSVEDRRRDLIGYLRAVIVPETVLTRVLAGIRSPRGVDIQFYPGGMDLDALPIYVRSSLLRGPTEPAQPDTRRNLEAQLHWTGNLDFADAQLTMIVTSLPRGPLATEHRQAWTALVAGLLLTGLVMAYLWIRERGERRLRLANALLATEIESAPDGVLVSEGPGRGASFNRRFVDLWTIPAEVARTRDSDTLIDAMLPLLQDSGDFLHSFLQHSTESLHHQITLKDGRVIDVNSAGLRLGSNSQSGRIWFFRDVTERVTTEEAVRRSEEKYRNLVESATDYLWEIDAAGVYTYVSPGVRGLLGYEPAEVVGKTLPDFMSPVEAGRIKALFGPIAAAKKPFSQLENTVIAKDGTELVLESSGVPIFAAAGAFAGYRGIDRNVTARKRAQAIVEYRGDVLHAVAAAATELVTAPSIDDAIPKALRMVGEAVRADRVLVMEVAAGGGQGALAFRYAWHSPAALTVVDPANFAKTAPAALGEDPWFAPLMQGKHVTATLSGAHGQVERLMEQLNIKSMLVIPLIVDGRFWGQIGFDDCRIERQWTAVEIDILRTLGDVVGTSMMRARYVQELTDANMIVENSPTILYRLRGEPALPMTYVSHNITLFGYDPAAMIASPLLYKSYIHPDDLPKIREAIAQISAPDGQAAVVDYRLRTADARYRWVQNRYTPIRDATGRLVEIEGILIDITERKDAEEKIALLARTDALTGLANRATFIARLRQMFASAKRGSAAFAVLYLDLDHFKDVNDTLGHPAGDDLLKVAAERLQTCLRETDLVARLGGDEFAVLQADLTDLTNAGALAEKIRAALAAPYQIAGSEVHITASVGVSPYTADTAGPDEMLSQADLALYRAKDEGRDQYRFHTESLDDQVRERVTLGEGLRRAVELNQLELHYQPQVKILTGEIVGMEALVRWNHPTRGQLKPADFLPIAEKTGAIVALGRWVLDHACRQMSEWRQAGIAPLTLAVNLSLTELRTGKEFVDTVAQTLTRWGLEAADLELDVTESMLARATFAQNDVLDRLRQLGVIIAIDDFGMQYSSLDYLKTYRVSRLKIPRPLIAGAAQDAGSAAMVRAIVGIAGELDVEVVAQGIETEEQRSFLSKAAAKAAAQGFYYCEPVPADRADELLRLRRVDPVHGEVATLDGRRASKNDETSHTVATPAAV